jgi:thymidylate kinase
MVDTKLILIDGIPGSGKSTMGRWLGRELDSLQIPNHFFHELQENHPLWIYDHKFGSFAVESEARLFMEKTKALLERFIEDRYKSDEIAIVESWLFQGTISFSLLQHMDYFLLFDFISDLQKMLYKLNPMLVYFFQNDVEGNWRWICNRGIRLMQKGNQNNTHFSAQIKSMQIVRESNL